MQQQRTISWLDCDMQWKVNFIQLVIISLVARLRRSSQPFPMPSSVRSLSRVRLFATPWTSVLQAFLSITKPQRLLKLMPIESVMPYNHLVLCRCLLLLPQSFPASGSFLMSQLLTLGGQSTGVSALASVLPMDIQDWFPLGLTSLISLQSKRLSRIFSNTTVQKH